MRNNGPVTTKECTFPATQKLISVTDTRGVILDCNDDLVQISGYTRQELIGQPHNIVRHPDMPAAAFAVMWQHLKNGQPWMGLVKNRCKNGDFYWVNAYVTPITEQGNIVGYESVRTCPSREQVARAGKLYQKINAGQKTTFGLPLSAENLFLLLALLIWPVTYLSGWKDIAAAGLLLSTLIYGVWISGTKKRFLQELNQLLPNAFKHELAIQTYTDDNNTFGAVKVAILSREAHLDTILTRIENAAGHVATESSTSFQLTQDAHHEIDRQQAETTLVATAVHQMTTAIEAVSKNVQETSVQADQADKFARESQRIAVNTRHSIEQLHHTVDNISQSVIEVSEQTAKIANAAKIIDQIAEQTNLLALNAAIEAARAGDQGRGFAVVADEVRQLAQRTQSSTKDIHLIVQELAAKTDAAVEIARTGTVDASEGVGKVIETEQILVGISDAIGNIANMSVQMAAAIEQQAHVAEGINQQVSNIAELAQSSLGKASSASGTITQLQQIANELHELVVRFRR